MPPPPPSPFNSAQMAAPPPETWTCCKCKATNLTANATRCPEPKCAHDKCDDCHKGPPSSEPGSPGLLFASAQPRYMSSHASSSQYPYSTMSNGFSTPRPMQPSQPSIMPRQYELGAYPPPPPPTGLRRNTYNNISGGYLPTSALGYSSVSASGYPPSSASSFTSNYGAASFSGSGRRTGYGRSFTASAPIGGGSGRNGVKPDMTGWWVCCQDNHLNNPALCPVLCGTCNHQRCGRCRVYRNREEIEGEG